ncbi:MAG: NAD(P)-dependent oxidoreductase [Thermoanaerobaculia bacterium]|nr:NAD(P)-dependent oxidoreductase [Thermoanaerobaculia bacterium]
MQPTTPDLTHRTVLLTGARGFIGSHLLARLGTLGAEVHAVSRTPPSVTAGATWHVLDLADAEAVDAVVGSLRPEIVYHLASHVFGARDLEMVLPTFRSNLASTVHLLTSVERAGGCRRFVLTGSLEEPDVETPLEPPASPYAAAKAAASAYARMFHALYGTPVVLARLFMVYGPAQRDLKKLVPYVSLALAGGREIKLSSGLRPVDWVFVDDVVEGLVRSGVAPGLEGQRVDLGSGRLETIRGVVERLYEIAGASTPPPFGTLPDRPLEQVRAADADRTQEVLGWCPRTTLEEGLRATFEWYREELGAGRIAL